MMTRQRKYRLKTKIEKSRSRLMESNPFFAILLMFLEFTAVPKMKKISTNGKTIFFSPDFIDRLYEYELDYILCHQIMHIVCGHIWKESNLPSADYHLACDIAINLALEKFGFDDEKYPHLGTVHRKVPGCKYPPAENAAPDEIFDTMYFSLHILDENIINSYFPDSDIMWSRYTPEQFPGEIIIEPLHRDIILCADKIALENQWGAVASKAAQAAGANNSSDKSNEFLSQLRELTQRTGHVLDWRKILNEFLQEEICDYSFSPPDKRFSDFEFFLPDFNEKEFLMKEILFMADTSGSVDIDDLTMVYSEIKGAIEQFSGKLTGKLGFFDTTVTPPVPFDTVDELLKIMPYGGGGTDFDIIFEYINTYNLNPSCIIIFTDGYCDFPDESVSGEASVLWVINNDEITPPWGKTARIIKQSR